MNNRFERIASMIVAVIITAFITSIVTIGFLLNRLNVDIKDSATFLKYNLTSADGEFDKLKRVYSVIKNRYYEDIDYEKLEQSAIDGLLYGLSDEYSYYMTEEDFEEFEEDTSGNYTGIGLYLMNNTETNKIQVITPIKDTPAYEAGIKTGDYIISIDGDEYAGTQLKDATNKIKKGKAGEKVLLTIERDGNKFDIEIERKDISLYKMEYEVLDGNIGYINIKIFNQDTTKDFQEAYKYLADKDVKGIIIDVRDNPGGLLTQVVSVCDMLLPKDSIIVYTVDKNGQRKDYTANKGKNVNIPITVLTNNGSASASEILSSALQDHGVATIIGENTYGKGVVQTIIPTVDGSYIKLTTSEYFTPNGNKINKIGVKPDVEVEDNEDTQVDEQLQKALEILKK